MTAWQGGLGLEIKYSKKKEELRKDPVMDSLMEAKDWFTHNTSVLMGALIVAIFIVGFFGVYQYMKRSAELKAQDAFGKAMIAYQALDGISAAALGVMIPLVVADITHKGGRFNLAIGIVGLASGIGGVLSTALGGVLADRIGEFGSFLILGGFGLCGFALLALFMPETHATKESLPVPAWLAPANGRPARASASYARRVHEHLKRHRRQA